MANPWWGAQYPSVTAWNKVNGIMGRQPAVGGFYLSAESVAGTYNYLPTSSTSLRPDFFASRGVEPMLTWQLRNSAGDPTADTRWNCDAVLSGLHDTYLATLLRQLGALQYRIRVRIVHEFDGNWYPWGCLNGNNGNTPAKLAQVWRKVVQLARDLGVTNVRWVWCPDSRNASNAPDLDGAFPGADWVDYLSCDSYNFGPFGAHDWRYPGDETVAGKLVPGMFDDTRAWYATNLFRKNGGVGALLPVIISEVASAFAPPPPTDVDHGDKNDWIANHFKPYFEAWNQCVGVMWMQDQGRGNGLDDGTDRPADATHPADTSGAVFKTAVAAWDPLPTARFGTLTSTVQAAPAIARLGRLTSSVTPAPLDPAVARLGRLTSTVTPGPTSPPTARFGFLQSTVVPSPVGQPTARFGKLTSRVDTSVPTTMKVRSGGKWVQIAPKVRQGGAWTSIKPYVRSGGKWVPLFTTTVVGPPPPPPPTYPYPTYTDLPTFTYASLYQTGDTPMDVFTTRVTQACRISLPDGFDEEIVGFGQSNYGIYAPKVYGIIGLGPDRARLRLRPSSMTAAQISKITATGNPLTLLRCSDGAEKGGAIPLHFYGFTLEGHDQQINPATGLPYNYSGFMLYYPPNGSTVTWVRLKGCSQGDSNEPPGETNSFNAYRGVGTTTIAGLEVDGFNGDGHQSGAATAINGSARVIYQDTYSHDSHVSGFTAGCAGSATTGTQNGTLETYNLHVKNNANHVTSPGTQTFRGLNDEGVSTRIYHENLAIDMVPGQNREHMGFNSGQGNCNDIQINGCTWSGGPSWANGLLTIAVPTNYSGAADGLNKQTTIPTVRAVKDGPVLTPIPRGTAGNAASNYYLVR